MGKIKIPVRRYGGKSYIAQWIVSLMPEHETYVEPFVGSGAVFFAKPPSQAEFLNDKEQRIINVFRQIQQRPFELAAVLWATPYSQEGWRDARETDLAEAQDYMARSVQFYAGNTGTSTFSVDRGAANKNKAHVWADWFQRILPAAARLKDAQLLCGEAVELVDRFADKPNCLFYVDPPYEGHESEYEQKVSWDDLEAALKRVKGKVMISGYENSSSRFADWHCETKMVTTRRRTGAHKMKADRKLECVWMNFTPAVTAP